MRYIINSMYINEDEVEFEFGEFWNTSYANITYSEEDSCFDTQIK